MVSQHIQVGLTVWGELRNVGGLLGQLSLVQSRYGNEPSIRNVLFQPMDPMDKVWQSLSMVKGSIWSGHFGSTWEGAFQAYPKV